MAASCRRPWSSRSLATSQLCHASPKTPGNRRLLGHRTKGEPSWSGEYAYTVRTIIAFDKEYSLIVKLPTFFFTLLFWIFSADPIVEKENDASVPEARAPNQALEWVPALRDGKDVRGRTHYQHQRGGSRSSSQPASTVRARSHSPPTDMPERSQHRTAALGPHATVGPSTSHTYTNGARSRAVNDISNYDNIYTRTRPQSTAPYHESAYRRKSDEMDRYRSADGRSSVPVDRSDRYVSAPTLYPTAEQRKIYNSRSSTLPEDHSQHHRQSVKLASGVQRSQTLPVEYMHSYDSQPPSGTAAFLARHQDRSSYSPRSPESPRTGRESKDGNMERVRKWVAEGVKQAAKDAARAAAERTSPSRRHTVEGFERVRSPGRDDYGHHRQEYRQDQQYRSDSQGRSRQPSLPTVIIPGDPVIGHMSDITEEPDEMAMTREYSGSMSDDLNSTDSSDSPVRRRRRSKHPLSRPPLERNDTIRLDDELPIHQILPSPKSLRQGSVPSSRIPSARSSAEHVRQEHANSPNRHLSPANSQVFHNSPSYNTPPITPTRQDYMYRHDESKSPSYLHYASQPSSASKNNLVIPNVPSPYRQSDHSPIRSGSAQPSGTFQTPARLQYLYQSSPSPSPQSHVAKSSAVSHPSNQTPYGYVPATSKGRSPLGSRSPSPLPPQSSSSPIPPNGRHGHQGAQYRPSPSSQPPASYSRGHGASSSNALPRSIPRHVRVGFWNRRGDHLTEDKYVVYCPPGRNYPKDLNDYPENAFKDHNGKIINKPPNSYHELADSVPTNGRSAVRPYDSVRHYFLPFSLSFSTLRG